MATWFTAPVTAQSTGGSIVAWGWDWRSIVSNTPTGIGFSAISGGSSHSLALTADGTIAAWGSDEDSKVSGAPTGNGFIAIAAGAVHSLALTPDGSIVSWGRDSYGVISDTPTGSGFTAIETGSEHSLALAADGSIVSWGNDDLGRVSGTPTGSGFIAIAAGTVHSLALAADGSIVSWGWDGHSQVVSGTPSGSGFTAIAGGGSHSLALAADGSIVSWGDDGQGQVSNTPTGGGFVKIAGGGVHSLALTPDGSIVSWGWDEYGQVANTPTGSGFSTIAGGSYHSLSRFGIPDADDDGIGDDIDNCAGTPNPGQENTDGDAQGDACDSDDDGDGLGDALELALGTDPLNPDTDGDGAGDGNEIGGGTNPLNAASFPDDDADGTTDQQDNCPGLFNPGQEDTDANGTGDACNSTEDSDGDEWANDLDNCPDLANADQIDADADTIGDRCDTDRDGDGFANQGTFGAQQIISTSGHGPSFLHAADLDGDGDIDVLSSSRHDDKIAWYENTDGLGTFGAQQVITTAADEAKSVHAADLDGDGDMDVLSASSDDNKIAWYENTDGLGTFGTQQVINAAANGAYSVYAADLDGDEDMDVVSAASWADNEIAWYENTDGLGTFGPEQGITTAANDARSVHAADLDGDGDMDVLSASYQDNKVAWYENTDGQGTFGPQHLLSSGAQPMSVYAADLDGDDDMDILAASIGGGAIGWNGNADGLGTFGGRQLINTSSNQGRSVHAADLDGDGDMDVLSGTGLDGKVAWYENTDGQGTFGAQQVITTAADQVRSVLAADLDGDGDMDVLSASAFDNKVAWYENTGFDNCPSIANATQADADGNGVGDACNTFEDADDDEWSDALDNCPSDYNPDQADTDGNGVADGCNDDEDADGDEWANELDNCPTAANFDQANSDGDARGDACDDFPSDSAEDTDTDTDGIGNNADDDDDGDGLGDAIEALLGTDPLNSDTDGDGLSDSDEIIQGTDPNDPNDPAPELVPSLGPVQLGALSALLLTLGLAGLGMRRRVH